MGIRFGSRFVATARVLLVAAVGGCAHPHAPISSAPLPPGVGYPSVTPSGVADVFHGVVVPDPYHGLEDADSKETRAWVDAENKLTESFVRVPVREKIKGELTKLWNFPKYSVPRREGDRYFYEKNDGLQNQAVVYRLDHLGDEPKVVIDPNTISADGTVALETQAYSFDGKLLAYGLSTNGSDRQEIHIRDIDTGGDLPEIIRWTKFTAIAWKHDNSGFYYNRFPEPGTVPRDDENNFCKVYWHQLNTPQDKDELVLERADDKTLQLFPTVTDDGKYLVVSIDKGTSPHNRVAYRPIDGGEFVKLLDDADAAYGFIDNVGTVFYFQTDLDAARGKIIEINTASPERKNWKTVVPEAADAIETTSIANNQFVLVYLHDAYHIMKVCNLDGSLDRVLDLPPFGAVTVGSSRRQYTELFLAYSSFATPASLYRYDFTARQMHVYHKSEIKADLTPYETKQVFATSKDGTKIPVFLTYRRGLKLDGSNPALLYGYGGFDVNNTPYFYVPFVVWLDHGGVYAQAILRGGGEYGETWHEAGNLLKKQNTFDDFQAAAKWLIDQKYTSPGKLAIQGASNGGLLTAACMLQTPQLFGAVVSEVPVTDMLRYKKFAAGVGWIPEYGDAEQSPQMFKALFAYSPLHNVKPGAVYPPVLVTTADSDDRVDPSHAKKFVATLQAAQQSTSTGEPRNPILLRIDTKAGHGGGKPMAKVIDEISDVYAFLFRVLGID